MKMSMSMKETMKKAVCAAFSLLLAFAIAAAPYAAESAGLAWDGRRATLSDIARETGRDFVDANGLYKPIYASEAGELWARGLFLGSGGSFALDEPLTRAEGTVMILRLLGKEAESRESLASSSFEDLPAWAAAQIAYSANAGIVKGYSETVFGSADTMQANQYITLVLRALGYADGEDFAWDSPYGKALEIGLIDESGRDQYARSNLFLRDDAAYISRNALFDAPTKEGGLLIDAIPELGKPEGDMPAARAYDGAAPADSEASPADGGDARQPQAQSQAQAEPGSALATESEPKPEPESELEPAPAAGLASALDPKPAPEPSLSPAPSASPSPSPHTSPSASPSPALSPSPSPSTVPSPSPSPSLPAQQRQVRTPDAPAASASASAITVISAPSVVHRNENASISIAGEPNTEYRLRVFYKSESVAAGLGVKTSDADGRVSWTWRVGSNTSAGNVYATITGNGETVRIDFAVEV
jgi:hypothetical protein